MSVMYHVLQTRWFSGTVAESKTPWLQSRAFYYTDPALSSYFKKVVKGAESPRARRRRCRY